MSRVGSFRGGLQVHGDFRLEKVPSTLRTRYYKSRILEAVDERDGTIETLNRSEVVTGTTMSMGPDGHMLPVPAQAETLMTWLDREK